MTDNVVEFGGITRLDMPPDRILEAAKGKLSSVMVIGFTADGADYFAASKSDAAEAIYFCERAKHNLMKIIDEMSE